MKQKICKHCGEFGKYYTEKSRTCSTCTNKKLNIAKNIKAINLGFKNEYQRIRSKLFL